MPSEYKVVVLGPSASGKTCIVTRLVHNTYNEYSQPTIGACFNQLRMGDDTRVSLWDTAGNTRFESIIPMYTRNATVALLCWSYDCPFDETMAGRFVDLCDESTQVMIVVTKIDLSDELLPHSDMIERWSMHHRRDIPVVYTSSKTGKGIEKLLANMHRVIEKAEPNHREESILHIKPHSPARCCF